MIWLRFNIRFIIGILFFAAGFAIYGWIMWRDGKAKGFREGWHAKEKEYKSTHNITNEGA